MAEDFAYWHLLKNVVLFLILGLLCDITFRASRKKVAPLSRSYKHCEAKKAS